MAILDDVLNQAQVVRDIRDQIDQAKAKKTQAQADVDGLNNILATLQAQLATEKATLKSLAQSW